MTGKPILVFENLDVKIASGLRKIQTRNFKKHFTTDKCKAQSEKGSLTGRHIAWMIHDLFKIRGEHGAILDFRDSSKVSWGQTCNRRALSKRKRERKCQKTTPKETASVGSRQANVHSEKHAHSSMTRTRKAKGRDDLVHLLRQVHRTDIRKVTEKVAMTEVLKTQQNWLVKVCQWKRTDYLVQNWRQEVANWVIHVVVGMFPKVQNSKLQVDANSAASVHTNTPQNLLMNCEIPHRLLFTFHRMMTDRCNYGKFSRMTRPSFEWDFSISRTSTFPQGRNQDLLWESSRLDLKISDIEMLSFE